MTDNKQLQQDIYVFADEINELVQRLITLGDYSGLSGEHGLQADLYELALELNEIKDKQFKLGDRAGALDMVLLCPAPEITEVFQINECDQILESSLLSVSITDNQGPTNTTSYDLWVDIGDGNGFVDAGPSIQHPSNQFPDYSVPTDGRTITKRVYRWDGAAPGTGANGLPNTDDYIECTCTAATLENHVLFTEIDDLTKAEYCLESPEEYLAETLRLNPNTCYWTIDTTQQCVFLEELPAWSGTVIQVATSAELVSALSGASNGDCIEGGGNTFTLSASTNISQSNIRLSNMRLTTSAAASIYINVNGNDVEMVNVDIDMQNQAIGQALNVAGDRFQFVKSKIQNIYNTDATTNSALNVRGDDVYIVGSEFVNLISENAPVRAIHWNNVTASGGIVAQNYFENLQSQNGLTDADAIVWQDLGGDAFTSGLLVMANTGVDMGKRMVKSMGGNARVYSNEGHWASQNGPLGYRNKRCMFDDLGWNDVDISNNYAISSYSNSNETVYGFGQAYNRSVVSNNKRMDCNVYEVNHGTGGTNDYGIEVFNWNGTTPDYPTASSVQDNHIIGSGTVRWAYHDRNTPNTDNFSTYTNFNLGTVTVTTSVAQIRNS